MKTNKKAKIELPSEIKYDGRVFIKTGYTATDNKTNKIVYEFRTKDERRIWFFEDGRFYED